MLSVHTGTYDSRSRALIRDVTGLLRLPWVQGELFENQLAHYLRGICRPARRLGCLLLLCSSHRAPYGVGGTSCCSPTRIATQWGGHPLAEAANM